MGDIVDWDKHICYLCERKFKSKMSLQMHVSRAEVHRKGSPFYHDKLEAVKRSREIVARINKTKKKRIKARHHIKLDLYKTLEEF